MIQISYSSTNDNYVSSSRLMREIEVIFYFVTKQYLKKFFRHGGQHLKKSSDEKFHRFVAFKSFEICQDSK